MLFEEKKYSTDGRECSLFGAFPSDSRIYFKLIVRLRDIRSVRFVIHNDGMNARETYSEYEMPLTESCGGKAAFECAVDIPRLLEECKLHGEGLFYYHYKVTLAEGEIILGGERPTELEELTDFRGERQLFIYSGGYDTSNAFRDGLVYHIFVDRFRRSGKSPVKDYAILNTDWDGGIPEYAEYPGAPLSNTVFFGGDLWGVIEKLDYIASLGTKTIYLSPVFDAHSNHKYDTGNYMAVDEMFGGDGALEELCKEAKKRDIDIILDGVFNHTGSDSIYFNKDGRYPTRGAYQSKGSPFYDWYSFSEYPDRYECWWGVDILPRVNSRDPDYRRFITESVVGKWMDSGVAGWRLDVVDEISDEFLDDFRSAVKKKNPDGVIIGEVWEDATDKVSYGLRRRYLGGRQLDSVMNYPLRSGIISYIRDGECEILRRATEELYRRYPKPSSDTLLNFLGTHDTERILTVLGADDGHDMTNDELAAAKMTEEERAAAVVKLKLAFSLLCGLPGVPCVFYGDEAGIEGYRDPFCRRPFPWDSINWELLEHYRTLGRIRREHHVFRDGLFRLISLTPQRAVYERTPWSGGCEKIVVAAVREGELRIGFSSNVMRIEAGIVGERFTLGAGESAYFSLPCDADVIL